jgi:hypothetical protein
VFGNWLLILLGGAMAAIHVVFLSSDGPPYHPARGVEGYALNYLWFWSPVIAMSLLFAGLSRSVPRRQRQVDLGFSALLVLATAVEVVVWIWFRRLDG